MDRRQFNQWLQASALSAALAPWQMAVQAQGTERNFKTFPFALGIASGTPQHDSVVIWTRLILGDEDRRSVGSDEIAGRFEVYADPALSRLVQKGTWQTNAERGHSVHVVLQGLAPARSYWYRFMCGDATSADPYIMQISVGQCCRKSDTNC